MCLAQLKHDLRSVEPQRHRRPSQSITSGAAWKAINGTGLAARLSGKYLQFVVDEPWTMALRPQSAAVLERQ
jgi:hypothetical protein